MRTRDTTTFDTCDNCGAIGQYRFYEINTDRGGQVCVWSNLPPEWLMLPAPSDRDFGHYLACSGKCAQALSVEMEAQVLLQQEQTYELFKGK